MGEHELQHIGLPEMQRDMTMQLSTNSNQIIRRVLKDVVACWLGQLLTRWARARLYGKERIKDSFGFNFTSGNDNDIHKL
jgi:hypothetical protein